MTDPKEKTNEEWRQQLNPQAYRVLREAATDPPFHSPYHDDFSDGYYKCAGCGALLFDAQHKFDAGCGWPSFDQPHEGAKIATKSDYSHGMTRTEVLCGVCGGHLGHVFDDGPKTTGLRFCINGSALEKNEKE